MGFASAVPASEVSAASKSEGKVILARVFMMGNCRVILYLYVRASICTSGCVGECQCALSDTLQAS